MLGWGQSKKRAALQEAPVAVGDLNDAAAILVAIDTVVPRYLESTDRGGLIYPACKRKPADPQSDIRSIWQHTRLEAARYITLVPGRQTGLLIEPGRQREMIDAFLRQQPHEKIIVDFTGAPADDLVIAIIAGLNWLRHCSILAGADHKKFSGTMRNFRKMVAIAQQWWAIDGAEARYAQMLTAKEKPPLIMHLIWQDYTFLAKEIASAVLFGPIIEETVTRRREMLESEFAGRPAEFAAAVTELQATMSRFEQAREPDDLLD